MQFAEIYFGIAFQPRDHARSHVDTSRPSLTCTAKRPDAMRPGATIPNPRLMQAGFCSKPQHAHRQPGPCVSGMSGVSVASQQIRTGDRWPRITERETFRFCDSCDPVRYAASALASREGQGLCSVPGFDRRGGGPASRGARVTPGVAAVQCPLCAAVSDLQAPASSALAVRLLVLGRWDKRKPEEPARNSVPGAAYLA
ncbi:hypothetical protein A1Q2_01901 [Trichosporon asahii var. asahii CBS 8904]|uniref:Uncharacterized protein n=2 Tax=Trichosporon asahii var. asahii TaxID=189963 RepID=K1W4S8_TRIAC|nr:hypothetical protein A1Q1_04326 [Trichosporon asahii var. asahii CBS 2479]EJT46934.1 hypothetical protein A1Q1_04326 [Trichosporon asahii var. asahii CBS 2479]EKD03888.1 hypothetical protein A1Q2_01901 [Trichosporon asahii var. asahii CBS 8904]